MTDRFKLLPKHLRPKILAEPLYERQKGESSQAWRAFVNYRDDEEGRSYTKTSQSIDRNVSLIKNWGARWHWQGRIEAWEKRQDQVKLEQQAKDKAEIFEMHGALARAMAVILGQFLQNFDPMSLTPAAAPKWLREIVTTQRQLYGEPIATVAVQSSVTPEGAEQHRRNASNYCTELRYLLPTNVASSVIRTMAVAKYDVAADNLPTVERLDSLLTIRRFMPEVRSGKWPS
jgi:hypothetical protein